MSSGKVHFLSDAHFRGDRSDREQDKLKRFESFIESIHEAAELYLLGDLFDFWFEYRRVVPKGHQAVFRSLRNLVDSGTAVTLIGGNHDWWIGSFLSDEIGLAVSRQPIQRRIQGRHLLLGHGDEFLRGDLGYKILKSVIRNRLFVGAASLLHPDFTYRAARGVSDFSRARHRLRGAPGRKRHLRIQPPRDDSVDAVIFGHLHRLLHRRGEGRELVCTGDWHKHFSHAELSNGEISLIGGNGKKVEARDVPGRELWDFVDPD